jgi:murein DD-endopeptidase MepM/ murein hydrolase activator NlpD
MISCFIFEQVQKPLCSLLITHHSLHIVVGVEMKKLKRIATLATCLLLVSGSMSLRYDRNDIEVSAMTVEELEAEQQANRERIEELRAKLADNNANQYSEQETKNLLEEKVNLQNKNIINVQNQIDTLNGEIALKESQISVLQGQIEEQQKSIDEGIETFKKRLVAMYISGNTDITSVLVGANDYFDILARVQMIESISKYDKDLIDGLVTTLTELDTNKTSLETTKSELELVRENNIVKRDEFKDLLDELTADLENSQGLLEQYGTEHDEMVDDIEALEEQNEILAQEQADLEEEIRRRQAEEEARRKAEEERRRAEEEARKNAENNSGNDITYVDPSTVQTDGTLNWPVPSSYYVTSGYGPRWGSIHGGIDIAAPMGTNIVAAESGIVITVSETCTHNYGKSYSCGCGGSYGNYAVISHSGTLSTLYGHFTDVLVSEGEYVERGQLIGTMGSTGNSTGSHLHFEVRVNGSRQNPDGYLY